jgi:pimeloyl-ACP methyl ester carboxylesterase
MASIILPDSPFIGGGRSQVQVAYFGDGPPLLFLHGGWGYDCYPVDVDALTSTHTIIIPSRTGYGNSTPVSEFPPEFHQRAALETLALLDALQIDQAAVWGHSDGAVIGARMAIHAPGRVQGLILEAPHYYADKPRSRAFFQQMATDPDAFGPSVRRVLAGEHGEDRWRTVLQLDGQAWLDLADNAESRVADVYGGQLATVSCPTLIVQGGRDPRSEPGELEALMSDLPRAHLWRHADAGHCPHWEVSKGEVTEAILRFLAELGGGGP